LTNRFLLLLIRNCEDEANELKDDEFFITADKYIKTKDKAISE